MLHIVRTVCIAVSFSWLSACSGGAGSSNGTLVPQSVHLKDVVQASPAPAPLTSVEAIRAAAFTDSVGLNTHWNYPAYNRSFQTAASLLTGLGVKHIRDGFVSNPASAAVYFGYLKSLQSSGVRATMLTSLNLPVATIAQNIAAVPNFTEAIEAPNEYDFSGDPLWATRLTAYQQALYTGVKADPTLLALPVVGPSFGWTSSYGIVGALGIGAFMDSGNMHNYFAGYNPGTGGWGPGGYGSAYGSIKYNLGAAAQAAGSKRIVATETGYCTVPGTRNAVSPTVQAKYIPRMYLEQWLAGVQRTISYELLDEGGSGCNATFGLLTGALTPKPAYYALKNTLDAFADTTASFQPAAVSMALTTPVTTIHRLLVQKSNGSYVLALWNETSGWDVNAVTGTPITVSPVQVSLRLAAVPAIGTVTTLGDDGNRKDGSLVWDASATASITVDDHLTLVTFKP